MESAAKNNNKSSEEHKSLLEIETDNDYSYDESKKEGGRILLRNPLYSYRGRQRLIVVAAVTMGLIIFYYGTSNSSLLV